MNAHDKTLALAREAGLLPKPKTKRAAKSALLQKIVANCEAEPAPKSAQRLLKVACPVCGYLVRTTRVWLAKGAPICPTDNLSMICRD